MTQFVSKRAETANKPPIRNRANRRHKIILTASPRTRKLLRQALLLHREISWPSGGSARSFERDFAGHGAGSHRRRHLSVGVHGESRFGFADGYAAGLLQAHARDRDLRSHRTALGTEAR